MSRLWAESNDNPLAQHRVLLAAAPPWREVILKVFEKAGITPQLADTLEEAIHSLKFQQLEFLLLTENFSSIDNRPDPLLEYIQNMSTPQRRELFVVFIGRTAKSGDPLSAFSQSVNLVLHPDKLQDLTTLITESWNFWKGLYQVFMQSRTQLTGH